MSEPQVAEAGLLVRRVRPRRRRSRMFRWSVRLAIAALIFAFLPVPWLHIVGDDPPGWAWRLDGRLFVDGQMIDPPGRWSWLTVGRPPLVYEAAYDRITGSEDSARDMRIGSADSRPAASEPLAAAVGLREAGVELQLGLFVEVSEPLQDGLPPWAVITEINGSGLATRADVDDALALSLVTTRFVTADGASFEVPGSDLPYERVRVIDLAPQGLEAAIGGRLTRLAPVAWFRSLSLGSSHGMMVALTTYAHHADADLGLGRHIAGTGGIRGDGSVSRIGGLPAKAQAAKQAGADILLFPASQSLELIHFDPGGMELVPVRTLADAITYLTDGMLPDPEPLQTEADGPPDPVG